MNAHPFLLFLTISGLSIFGVIGSIFIFFITLRQIKRFFSRVELKKLKSAIKQNPAIGQPDTEGNFIYRDKGFILKYRVLDPNNNELRKVAFISIKRKLENFEIQFARFKDNLKNFWAYRQWEIIFRTRVFFALFFPLLILYLAVFEPEADKIYRLRWIISRAAKVDIDNVAVKPGGWVKISGTRRTVVDGQVESISYNVNLFKWLTFQDDGYIMRDRGGEYGIVSYPIRYDEQGNIEIEKEGKWIEGKRDSGMVNWQEPQGTGIRAGQVRGENTNLEDKSSVMDK